MFNSTLIKKLLYKLNKLKDNYNLYIDLNFQNDILI